MAHVPTQIWWTADEIAAAALPDLAKTRQGIDAGIKRLGWRDNPALAQRRVGKGGGWEYHWTLFPARAQRKLLLAAAAPKASARIDRGAAWAWYESLPQAVKDRAEARLLIIQQVEALEPALGRFLAVSEVAMVAAAGERTIWAWFAAIEGVRPDDRLPHIAPRNQVHVEGPRSGARFKECDPAFFDVIKSTFLRLAGPAFSDCYRAAVKLAMSNGWDILPERTMRRRLDVAVSRLTQTLARQGVAALKRLYPPQVRDKSALVAMEAVNADGHTFDVFVEWPAPVGQNAHGDICRPVMSAFQDIYSGRILSWRIDQTVNSTAVQLAAGDMIEAWGIPQHVLFDNGREYAAKSITGGAPTRFRFKVKEDDPLGLFVNLGCTIHWATPYHGQAKPIERAFRDMCQSIAKDVRFDGAYTGNKPTAKPEDYGSRAIKLDYFLKVLGEGIAEHNARQNRKSPVAYNRSFVEVFDESYATAPIRKATEAQRRLWLLGAEGLRADRNTGAVWFEKNEFWDNWMHEIAGERVIVRFDPADFLLGLHVYAQDGAYLGHAPVRQAVGFFNSEEARIHARARNDFIKAEKTLIKAHKRYEASQVGDMLDAIAPVDQAPVEAKVVKPVFGKPLNARSAAEAPAAAGARPMSAEVVRFQAEIVTDLATRRGAAVATASDPMLELFRRALDVEQRLLVDEPVTAEEQRWLTGFQSTSDYRVRRMLWDDVGDAIFG